MEMRESREDKADRIIDVIYAATFDETKPENKRYIEGQAKLARLVGINQVALSGLMGLVTERVSEWYPGYTIVVDKRRKGKRGYRAGRYRMVQKNTLNQMRWTAGELKTIASKAKRHVRVLSDPLEALEPSRAIASKIEGLRKLESLSGQLEVAASELYELLGEDLDAA
jgi:hypothetical protein